MSNSLYKHAHNFLDGSNENRFIVMSGLRGVGKTTLLFQLYDYLTNEKGIEQDKVLYNQLITLANIWAGE